MSSIRTVFYFFVCVTPIAFATAKLMPVEEEISRQKFGKGSLSLYAATDREVLISVNSEALLIPASISKIATAAAVLRQLGPTTRWTTQLRSSSPIENGILKGDLYLQGAGDPGFVSETMWVLVNELSRNQITQVAGDINVDDSLFDTIRFDPSREPVRNDRAYDAPVGAMSMNWNAVNVFVRPTRVGESAIVIADPETNYIQLLNHTKTVTGRKVDIDVSRKGQTLSDEDMVSAGDVIVVSGTIGQDAPEKVIYKSISQPDLWSGYNLMSFMKQRGMRVSGHVKSAKTPTDAKLLAHAESKPVSLMVQDMLKFSNNFVAEMLTKQLALKISPEPASLELGLTKIRQTVREMGFKDSEFQIFNPSGFSRKNHFSARVLQGLLVSIKKDFLISPEFMSALPISGRDGTLKSRMVTLAQQVRAKTGSMTGIVSLAGFVNRGDGEVATFAFLFNGSADKADKARALMDHLCERLKQK